MPPADVEPDQVQEVADPTWFRKPTRRERLIATALFVAFGAWFIALFVVYQDWWFRWVILILGVISIVNGLRHLVAARSETTA